MGRVRLILSSLLVGVALLAPGCCSMVFTLERPAPYAGARGVVREFPLATPGGMEWVNALVVIDLPFTIVLDTVLLPFTCLTGLIEWNRSRPGAHRSPPPRGAPERKITGC